MSLFKQREPARRFMNHIVVRDIARDGGSAMGRMNIVYRLLVMTLALVVGSTAQVCTEAKADMAIVIDASGSIEFKGPGNWPAQLNFVRRIIDSVNLGQNDVRISLTAFSTNVSVQFYLDTSFNKETLKRMVNQTIYTRGTTNTAGAINVVISDVFTTNRGDRPGVPNLCIVVTDGQSTNPAGEAVAAADNARKAGIMMVAIGVTNDVNILELKGIANDPDDQFYFKVDSFDQLEREVLSKVLNRVCETVAPTAATTTPLPPPTGCPNSADFVLMLDSSGSIKESRWPLVKSFADLLVQQLDIDSGRIRVGLVQYASTVQSIFQMNRFSTRTEVRNAISNLQYTRGTTDTAAAIDYARRTAFVGNGERNGVRNILVIITDGGSDDPRETLRQAFLAKTGSDITIICVGVGDWVNEAEILNLASHPYAENRIRVRNFNDLNIALAIRLRNIVCNGVNECANNPCRNGGQCIDGINTYYCVCRNGFAGRDCTLTCRERADVVVNLDTSGSIGLGNYQTSMDFTANLLHALSITNMDRIGFITYASNVQRFFYLNQLSTKERYLNALGLAYTGGTTNTASSLSYLYRTMFQSNNGDRAGIKNVAITVTDGRSNNPADTFREAINARARGIHMVAVGVSSAQEKDELISIASYPSDSNVLSVQNPRDLSSLTNQIVSLVCNNVNDCSGSPCQNNGQCSDNIGGFSCRCRENVATGKRCERRCTGNADIVFIIDSSGSIHHERFRTVLDFLIGVADNLEIASDRTRVGALIFSDNAQIQFHLNAYTTKQDVMHGIRRIQFMGGRTNIADALRTAREQMFTSSNGDRSTVQNFIVLFTDGESNVNVDRTIPEAIDTRVDNIHIISVGVGLNPRMSELVATASQPTNQNVITANRFSELNSIINRVVSATCDDTNECNNSPCQEGGRCIGGIKRYVCVCISGRTGQNCERSCPRSMDVMFLLDVSGSVEIAYTITQAFAQRVAYGLHVNEDRVRVGLITFSTSESLRFNLNKYPGNLQAVINAMVVPVIGDRTNIGAALNLARTSSFTNRNGERSGSPNRIILVTDGNQNVNEFDLSREARDARNSGIEIFVVGIANPNLGVINDIATDPDSTHTFTIRNSGEVASVANQVLDRLCQ